MSRDDVLREVATSRRYLPGRRSGNNQLTTKLPLLVGGELEDRVVVLEEVARRQRIIDEHREEVERAHIAIAREQREIAELLLGPSRVPND